MARLPFYHRFLRLENAFYEYDKLGSKLAEELRTAVLLRSVTGQLKVWLQLQIDDSFGYDKVRELILSYERSTAKWTEQMVLGASMTSDTSAPMEVDRIQKGKGSGKGQKGSGKKGDPNKGGHGYFKGKSKGDHKGKGKFSDKGKGKSKNSKSSGGKSFDGTGHGGQWSDHSKGKGYGQFKGRGDSGKGGKSTSQCWHCGGNHKAADCFKNNHVRQVLMDRIHHSNNDSSSNNSLLHLRLSLPSHSAFQIQQRPQQHQPQHIVLTVYLRMMILKIWFSICVAVMWTFQTCEFVL